MARRFPARGLIALALGLLLVACIEVTPKVAGPETPEAELALQSRALQRTIQEAAVAGALAGAGGAYVFGGRSATPALGILVGIPVGVAAGSYVGYLQQQYATNEARLERLRADIDLTNAETEATIRTMRVVLERQRQALAATRAQAGAGSPELTRQIATAEKSLADMRGAIDGAERRRSEFGSTRGLQLVNNELTGVDRQIADLGQRIAEMRAIAGTLAQDI
jgi:hypothetical protein